MIFVLQLRFFGMNKSFVETILLFYAFSAKCQCSVPVTFPDTVTAAAAAGVSRAVGEFAISFCAGSFCNLSRVVKILEKKFL